jgi:hypothetical protein
VCPASTDMEKSVTKCLSCTCRCPCAGTRVLPGTAHPRRVDDEGGVHERGRCAGPRWARRQRTGRLNSNITTVTWKTTRRASCRTSGCPSFCPPCSLLTRTGLGSTSGRPMTLYQFCGERLHGLPRLVAACGEVGAARVGVAVGSHHIFTSAPGRHQSGRRQMSMSDMVRTI